MAIPPLAMTRFLLLFTLLVSPATFAEDPAKVRHTWDVDGVEREAWLSIPASAKEKPTPVVFVFHGHGGRMIGAARMFRIHKLWPEAIVAYPQGLKTPGMLTDPEGKKPGWQSRPGKEGDRDLKFFDTMLADLAKKYQVDAKRVYSTGHSNGGGFTYLLWAERGDKLAAVAPSAAAGARKLRGGKAKPLPAMHIAGTTDLLVKFAWQQDSIESAKKFNGCAEEGEAWAKNATIFSSNRGAPVVAVIYPGGHRFYSAAPELIVRFFKQFAKE